MSMCYLCDLCDVYHKRGCNNGKVYWTCESLPLMDWVKMPFAIDWGKQDPHEICKHFERKEGGDDR